MIRWFLCPLILSGALVSQIDGEWLSSLQGPADNPIETIDPKPTEELGFSLDSYRQALEMKAQALDEGASPCATAEQLVADDSEPTLLVFMSWSVPVSTWMQLSPPVQGVGGAFVLRGLPKGGFSDLVSRIRMLDERGVKAPILIDPLAFERCRIRQVPAFVIEEDDRFDKVTGNISLSYALQLMTEKGETRGSARLMSPIRGTSTHAQVHSVEQTHSLESSTEAQA